MIKIKLSKRPPLLSEIFGNNKSNIARALSQSTQLVKTNIKKELRSPNKTGELKRSKKYGASPLRRSAPGESLARDTGASEKLIASTSISSVKSIVGFKENPYGFDYVKYQEDEKNRPTMKKAIENSEKGIENIFDSNLKPKK